VGDVHGIAITPVLVQRLARRVIILQHLLQEGHALKLSKMVVGQNVEIGNLINVRLLVINHTNVRVIRGVIQDIMMHRQVRDVLVQIHVLVHLNVVHKLILKKFVIVLKLIPNHLLQKK
jgi:hypothetical protein